MPSRAGGFSWGRREPTLGAPHTRRREEGETARALRTTGLSRALRCHGTKTTAWLGRAPGVGTGGQLRPGLATEKCCFPGNAANQPSRRAVEPSYWRHACYVVMRVTTHMEATEAGLRRLLPVGYLCLCPSTGMLSSGGASWMASVPLEERPSPTQGSPPLPHVRPRKKTTPVNWGGPSPALNPSWLRLPASRAERNKRLSLLEDFPAAAWTD